MKKVLYASFIAIAAMGFTFVGCKKDSTATASGSDETVAASDHEQAEHVSNDANNLADASANTTSGGSFRSSGTSELEGGFSPCVKVTKKDSAGLHYVIIDFGSTNCTCRDGRNRRGQILVSHNKGYFDSTAVKTISFNNYYVNDNKIEGTKTVTNNGRNSAGHYSWTISDDIRITRTDGKFHTWKSTRNREQINDGGTKFIVFDDTYSITGGSTGTSINGSVYSATITKALIRHMSCQWIDEGTIDFAVTGKPTRTLDYGNGNCDSEASVSVNGKVYTITLH